MIWYCMILYYIMLFFLDIFYYMIFHYNNINIISHDIYIYISIHTLYHIYHTHRRTSIIYMCSCIFNLHIYFGFIKPLYVYLLSNIVILCFICIPFKKHGISPWNSDPVLWPSWKAVQALTLAKESLKEMKRDQRGTSTTGESP